MKTLEELTKNGRGEGTITGIEPHAYLLTGLVVATDAKMVLEIGTGWFYSGQAFLHGLEITGGFLISCDPNPRVEYSSHPQFTFIKKKSSELIQSWNKIIDILFIDDGHEYEEVKSDYENFSPFVKKGGLILLHDTKHKYTIYPGPERFCKEIFIPKISLNLFPGLTMVQK